MKKHLITVGLLVVACMLSGCHSMHGAAKDAHGLTGWAVEVTAEPMKRAEYRDIQREMKLLNERTDVGWLKRLQGTKID